MAKIDDIRALIDPQGYLDSLESAKQVLNRNLGTLLVDYDLTDTSPTMKSEIKIAQKKSLMDTMKEVQWRLEEIDRRITAARNGAMRSSKRKSKR